MNKIYKRETLGSEKRERRPENWTRERNVILHFRVTEEEKRKIEKRIELSGLSKQDFFYKLQDKNAHFLSNKYVQFL